jgi:hypothetical protein
MKLEASFWNTKYAASRFYACDASLNAPFTAPPEEKDHWIYVTRESLNGYLEALSLERAKHPRGRPPDAGSMAKMDEPHILKMLQLLQDGKATSPHDAARQVAVEARGASVKSTQTRLRRRFVTRFPNWKQELRSN